MEWAGCAEPYPSFLVWDGKILRPQSGFWNRRSSPSNLNIPAYVLDAHALYWYWSQPALLGTDAQLVFRQLEVQAAVGFVPTIVLFEIDSLLRRRHQPQTMMGLVDLVEQSPALRLEPLSRDHLVASNQLSDLVEIHDRIIAAAALVNNATLVTRDTALRRHPLLQTAW